MKRNMGRGSNREDLGTFATSVVGALVLLLVVSGPIAAQPPEPEHLGVATIQNSFAWPTAMPANGVQLVNQEADHPAPFPVLSGSTKAASRIQISFTKGGGSFITPEAVGDPPNFGGARVTTSCFPKRGRAIDLRTTTGKFDHNGNWAHAFKIPGQKDCTFDYVVATLNGTYRQPANMPIDMITNLQSLPANAQPRCYSKFFTCLQHARFRVSVNWRDAQGSGRAIGMATNDTSAKFYFFNADDTEMVVKGVKPILS